MIGSHSVTRTATDHNVGLVSMGDSVSPDYNVDWPAFSFSAKSDILSLSTLPVKRTTAHILNMTSSVLC